MPGSRIECAIVELAQRPRRLRLRSLPAYLRKLVRHDVGGAVVESRNALVLRLIILFEILINLHLRTDMFHVFRNGDPLVKQKNVSCGYVLLWIGSLFDGYRKIQIPIPRHLCVSYRMRQVAGVDQQGTRILLIGCSYSVGHFFRRKSFFCFGLRHTVNFFVVSTLACSAEIAYFLG